MNIKNLSIILDEKLTTVGVQYGNGKVFSGDTYTFVARRENVDEWSEGVILLVQNNDMTMHIAKLVRIDSDVCFDEHDGRTYSYVVGIVNPIEADQIRAEVDERADHIRNHRRKAQRQALRESYAAGTLQIEGDSPVEVAKFVEGGPVFEQSVGRSRRKTWVKIPEGNLPFKEALKLDTQIRFMRTGLVGYVTGRIIRINHTEDMNVDSYTVIVGGGGTMTVIPENITEYHV